MRALRGSSSILGAVFLSAIVAVAATLVYHIVSSSIVNAIPHKAAIEMHAVARLDRTSLGRVYVTAYISCAGPYCSKYTVRELFFTLYFFRNQNIESVEETYVPPTPVTLRNGVVKLSYVIYYSPPTAIPSDLVVRVRIFPPEYRGLGWDFLDLVDSVSFSDNT